jgi:hypothetical protein
MSQYVDLYGGRLQKKLNESIAFSEGSSLAAEEHSQ